MKSLIFFIFLVTLIHSSLSITLYGTYPTCAPESSFTVITFNGTGFDAQNITITVGTQTIDPSLIVNVDNTSFSFLTPKNLVAGVYDIQLCSQGVLSNCSEVCYTNCTTPAPTPINCTTPECSANNTDTGNSTCTKYCNQECVQFNSTCITTASFTVYDVPAIVLGINPSSIKHKSYVSLYGKNFLNCGAASVRLQSNNNVQVFPAWVNSSAEIVFYADTSLSGILSLSLDGQHFDSVSVSPMILNVASEDSTASDSLSPNSDDHHYGSPNYVWLYVVLGIVGLAAGGFLVYVIYRYKVKDDYSRLYDL